MNKYKYVMYDLIKIRIFFSPVWCLQSPSQDVYSLQNLMQKSLTISRYSLEKVSELLDYRRIRTCLDV